LAIIVVITELTDSTESQFLNPLMHKVAKMGLSDRSPWRQNTRSPAFARDGRPYWPSRKTVIPSGIGLAAVLGVGQLSWLVKL